MNDILIAIPNSVINVPTIKNMLSRYIFEAQFFSGFMINSLFSYELEDEAADPPC